MFTGYSGKSVFHDPCAQTGWQYSINNKVAKNAISFKTANAAVHGKAFLQYFAAYKIANQI
ncbi:MAG: hypothetical protein ABJB86_16300, partial [Bacteroidota bacterium]